MGFFCGPTWARTRDHLIMSQKTILIVISCFLLFVSVNQFVIE